MSDEPIICVWCHKPIEGTKQSEVSPTSGFAHERSCDRLLRDHRRKHIDNQVSAAEIIREYREGGPSGPCPDCEELREKVGELEAAIRPTMDEAIAEMDVDPSQYTEAEFKVAIRNRAWARMGSTGAIAACTLTGCHYENGAAALNDAIDAYWSSHARPEPEEEWREVPPRVECSLGAENGCTSCRCRLYIREVEPGVWAVDAGSRSYRIRRAEDSRRFIIEKRTGGDSE